MVDKRQLKRGLVFESVRLRHRLTSKPSIACVDATNQRRLFLTCSLETEIGEQFHVTKGDIRKRMCSRARVGCGHVRHAIMRNTFLDVNWIKVRGGSRCFRAAALIDRNIY